MKSFCLALGLIFALGPSAQASGLEELRDMRGRWAALLALQDLNLSLDGTMISPLSPMSGSSTVEGLRAGWKSGTTNFDFFRFLGSGGSYRGYAFEVARDGERDICNIEVTSDGDLGAHDYSRVSVHVWGCVTKILAVRGGAPLEDSTLVYSQRDLKSKILRCEQAYRDTNELCAAGAPRAWDL